MKILIVSATYKEVEQTISYFKISRQDKEKILNVNFLNNEIYFMISGIGSYSMTYELAKILSNQKFDIVINAGIAGSYDSSIEIGTVVSVITEQIGDLGINNHGVFRTAFEEKFLRPNSNPFTNKKLVNPHKKLFKLIPQLNTVNSLTVNTVSGEKSKIIELKNKFKVQVESMEGAAFFYVCLNENQPFLEIRSISNLVEPRNKENWQILKAINNLNDALRMLIFELLKR